MTRTQILSAIDKELTRGRPECRDLHDWLDEILVTCMREDSNSRHPLPSEAPPVDHVVRAQRLREAIVRVTAVCVAALEAQP